ncbi:NUDIX hydrolase [Bacillus sp. SCS-153A]|uniref:NUDIX hydrolase n=1 Tax=Rossellomorea sedimentorum TaxID=3115294 RepID=UPI0039068E26
MDVVFNTEKAVFNYRVAGIWVENGHVLLHRAVDDNHWSLPGGRVVISEDSKSSLRREFLEELNVNIIIDRLVWLVENFFNYNETDFHEIGFYYLVKSVDHSFKFDENPFYGVEGERLVYKWTAISELSNVQLYPEFLRTALTALPLTPEYLVVKQ